VEREGRTSLAPSWYWREGWEETVYTQAGVTHIFFRVLLYHDRFLKSVTGGGHLIDDCLVLSRSGMFSTMTFFLSFSLWF